VPVAAASFRSAVLGPDRAHDAWWLWPGTALALGLAGILALTRAARHDPAVSPRWSRCAAAALFLVSFLVFMSNRATVTSGDNAANRVLPVSIASGAGFDLERVAPPAVAEQYAFRRIEGRLVARYPIGTGLAATPFYFAAQRLTGTGAARLIANLSLEKAIAAFATALAAVFLFAAARRFAAPGPALVGALAFSFATPALTNLSQGLWSHTGEIVFFAAGLALLAGPVGPERAAGAGAALAYAVLCRPTAVLLAPIAVVYLLPLPRRSRLALLVGGAAVLATAAWLQAHLYGSPFGAYVQFHSQAEYWSTAGFLERLAGVLASPSRGLLVFFPLLLFTLALPALARGNQSARWLHPVLIVSSAGVVLTNALFTRWAGGHSLGPRLLAELSVPTALALALALRPGRSRPVLAAVLLLLGWQAVVHLALQQSPRARSWNARVFLGANPAVLWSWRNGQLAAAFVPGWEYVDDVPYERRDALPAPEGEPRWSAVSLRKQANARYDVSPGEGPASGAYLPRLAAAHAALSDPARFDLLPPGAPNVVRTCTAEVSPAIPVGLAGIAALDTLILWRQESPTERVGPKVGHVRLVFGARKVQRVALRVGRDVFDTRLPRPRAAPRLHGLYAGGPLTVDALVAQRFSLRGLKRTLHEIRIEGPPPSLPGCLDLLAISVGAGASAAPSATGADP
jgi:hypothetical protein